MLIEEAKEVLRLEAQGILSLVERVGPEFEKAVNLIMKAKGRVIITGMGKSGLVARKISATFSSTGTPSFFLHPAEASHGDLGMVKGNDIVIAISNGGNTPEVNMILPLLREMGAKIISFTGGLNSPMSKASDIVIDVGVEKEACPMGLAPTTSTTAALAMGDALAVVLINQRRFGRDDFKKFHPGGSLGERLSSKVRDFMLTGERIPFVPVGTVIREAIRVINEKKIGATLVVDPQERLVGMVCDGDLRRALAKHENVNDMRVEELMTGSPKTVDEELTTAEALGLMELYGITHLVVVDRHHRVKGLLHLHDILGREEFRVNGAYSIRR
ncbi:Arabinose 5-phosphate isomerase KdsD [uncultured Desulfobacterium sp.]|uniref:Arabinose 5-phosphate isomerase KdsD n=1 Tax=uncultured Desulfobacterium sp. TaxID=201089 RepID=A0A445MS89_9BACT|nr:Arabinose 5-phosphate isomerase KdsD [uncultured Desulfobacterium sp.]